MANTQSLKRRIKTAGNIRQITKAMEMVSASKMRRAQSQALASRPYAVKLQETLQTIAALSGDSTHPLLTPHEGGRDMIVLISTDKSLAGSLNTNLFRGVQDLRSKGQLPKDASFIIVGQKARHFVLGNQDSLYAEFTNLPDPIRYQDALPIAEMVIQGFLDHEFHSVTLVYMDFVSTLVQRLATQQLLPIPTTWQDTIKTPDEALELNSTYVFEPSAAEILDWLLPYYVELAIYHSLLESKASEHSARMVAMKNASENAGEIINDLTLTYNKMRQAGITSELLDNTTASLIVAH